DAVDGSPMEFRIWPINGVVKRGIEFRRCEWPESGPSHLWIEQAARGQHRVAHRFPFEAMGRIAPQKAIVRIDGCGGGVKSRRLLVSLRRHDQPVQCLETPA